MISQPVNFQIAAVQTLRVILKSSRHEASITVDGQSVLRKHSVGKDDSGRGLHLVVLDPTSGLVTSKSSFDTYTPGAERALVGFLNELQPGRLVLAVIKDEASFSLKTAGRDALAKLGSRAARELAWRDTMVLAAINGNPSTLLHEQHHVAPSLETWGEPIELLFELPLGSDTQVQTCSWPEKDEFVQQREFCARHDGYGRLCDCQNPLDIGGLDAQHSSRPEWLAPLATVPVAVIASNRPRYLQRALISLLSARGVVRSNIVVFIDGFHKEPEELCRVFKVQSYGHQPQSKKNGRIAQHYRASLTHVFELFPAAQHVIVMEEDLEVAPDFFSFFGQTLPLMLQDPTLYCISAWNDQGYEHSSQDPGLLYRVDTMPGLGWLLSRALYKGELEHKWPSPEKLWDWDMWMRMPEQRQERECIIPDVSRTFHFGAQGVNMNDYFQDTYFAKHRLNTLADVELKDLSQMVAPTYDQMLENLLRSTHALSSTKPCSDGFMPSTHAMDYAFYIHQDSADDMTTWLALAKCWRLWDLDARGFHKGWVVVVHGSGEALDCPPRG